ncbi:MAG: hypothetical protein Q8R44_03255 [Novosphingobium sp.]|nr:hypothetical protein [Novosphingobium sp.]
MTDAPTPPDMAQPDLDEYRARQRGRNRALGVVLAFFAVLFFVITLVKIGGNVG